MVPSFRVDTGTICPFPLIWPSNSLDQNITLAVSTDCTITYADRLGAGYIVIQCMALVIPMFSLVVLLWQLFELRRYTKRKSTYYRLRDNAAFGFFICAINFNICLALQGVDLFNFHGLYPVEFYALLDELIASFFMALAVLLVDFWIRCAKFKSKVGFPPRQLFALLLLIVLNFVGWIIVGISDPAHYRVYEGIKSLGGGILLSSFFIKAVFTVRELRNSLASSSLNVSDHSKRAVRILVRKFAQFSFVLLFAVCVLMVNGIIVLVTAAETNEWHWKVNFYLQPDPLLYTMRGLFFLGSLACLLFFRVPNNKENQVDNEEGFKPTAKLASKELSPVAMRTQHEITAQSSAMDGPVI
ncbi:hypothetical protein BASA81_005564 [Batrachochytrium salamandrivorans]|nr:hypothetical protein BASA81_005564 [Batrachochytrium salamandrivorans]